MKDVKENLYALKIILYALKEQSFDEITSSNIQGAIELVEDSRQRIIIYDMELRSLKLNNQCLVDEISKMEIAK